MELFQRQASEETPFIVLDKASDRFVITGRSFPEDAFTYYAPVLAWIRSYAQSPNELTIFDFNLEYFNTASSRQFFKIFIELERIAGIKNVLIRWHYRKEDYEMRTHGEIFSNIIMINFELIEQG